MLRQRNALLTACLFLLPACSAPAGSSGPDSQEDMLLLVGTQNGEKVTTIAVTPSTGKLKMLSETAESCTRFFSPQDQDFIFGVCGSRLQVSRLDPQTKQLRVMKESRSDLGGPTSVDHSAEKKIVLTAHFREGLLTARSYDSEGFGPAQKFKCGEAHHFRFHPSGKWAYAACRKQTVRQFSVDAAGVLTPMEPAQLTAEDGPRHIDFHPNGRVMYVLLEKSSEIAVFDIDQKTGALSPQAGPYVPMTASGEGNKSSDLHITPNAKWLYGFNRVNESMARYAVADSGALTFLGETEMQRGLVRRWAMDPQGRFLITASYENTITLWHIDNETGALSKSDEIAAGGKASWAGFIDSRD